MRRNRQTDVERSGSSSLDQLVVVLDHPGIDVDRVALDRERLLLADRAAVLGQLDELEFGLRMRFALALIEHRDLGHAMIDLQQPQRQVELLILLGQPLDLGRLGDQLGRLFPQLAIELSPLVVNLIGDPAAGCPAGPG